ncbi:hypothetical protein QVD99_001690 [Batrachochytrium dendrobatidis]|nr:hypothetical protein O5D80_000337 [Batrachochytrium dendrobatidis]KAK5671861.1 hypothetical protein QVD99_001690 [Batrachochytrium dendrobatidis]
MLTATKPASSTAATNPESTAGDTLSRQKKSHPPGRFVSSKFMQPKSQSHSAAISRAEHRSSDITPVTFNKSSIPATQNHHRLSNGSSLSSSGRTSRLLVGSSMHASTIKTSSNPINQDPLDSVHPSLTSDPFLSTLQPPSVAKKELSKPVQQSPLVNHDDEQMILNARMLQIQLVRVRTEKAFAAQTISAHTQLKKAAAYIMQLQTQIDTLQQQSALRDRLVQSVDILRKQQADMLMVKTQLGPFIENYKTLLNAIETTSKVVRLNGISTPDQDSLIHVMDRASKQASNMFSSHLDPKQLANVMEISKADHDEIESIAKSIKESVALCNQEADIAMIHLSKKIHQIELACNIPNAFQ